MSSPDENTRIEAPKYPNFPVDELHYELKCTCLREADRRMCASIAARATDPSERENAKAELEVLFRAGAAGELSNKELTNLAEAWVLSAEARLALKEERQSDVDGLTEAAFALLTSNLTESARRRRKAEMASAKDVCVEAFCDAMLDRRPKGGWDDHSHAAATMAPVLASIIRKHEEAYGGRLWKRDPADLILEWLEKARGPVYEAYRGRSPL